MTGMLTNSGIITVIFIIIMFAIACFYYKKYYNKIKKIVLELENLNKKLQSMDNSAIENDYETISQSFLEDPIIGEVWLEYEKTLTVVDDKVYSTVAAEYYFSEDSMITAKFNKHLYNNLGGVFTGLGILGTFVGLSFGLYGIDMTSNDVEVIKKGISGLLSGTQTAFLTSVFGMIFALAHTYYNKSEIIKPLGIEIEKLHKNINKMFSQKNVEAWLAGIYKENNKQSTELLSFNTTLANSIGDALEEKINQNFMPIFEELLGAIKELNSGGTTQIAESLQKSSGKEMKAFSETLVEVQETMKKTVDLSQNIARDLSNGLHENAMLIMKQMANGITETVEYQQKANKESCDNLREMYDEVGNNMQSYVREFQKMGDVAGEHILNSVESATKTILKISNGLEENSKFQIENIEKTTISMFGKVQEIIVELEKTGNSNMQQVQTATTILKELVVESKTVIMEAKNAANIFSSAAQPVKETSLTLQDNLGKLNHKQEEFNNLLFKITSNLNNNLEKNEKMAKFISESLSETEKSWKAYENRFENIKGGLQEVFTSLDVGLNSYQKTTERGLTNSLQAYDKYMSTAIDHLASGISELNEGVESLDKIIDKLGKY